MACWSKACNAGSSPTQQTICIDIRVCRLTGPVQALPASAAEAGTSNNEQQRLPQQAAGEPHAVHASAEQLQQSGTEPAPSSSSNGHAEAGKPDLQQPKVKQEPCEDDSAAGQPHQAADALPSSSSNAAHFAEVKQEGGNQMAEPMRIDLPADNVTLSSQPASVNVLAGDMPISGQARTEQSEGEAGMGTKEQAGTGGELAVVPEQAAVQVAPISTEEAAERCELLCALCTKSPQLLRMLLEVFGKVQHKSPEPRHPPSCMCLASRAEVLERMLSEQTHLLYMCRHNSKVLIVIEKYVSPHPCVKPVKPEEMSVHLLHMPNSITSLRFPPPLLLFHALLLEPCICCVTGAKVCLVRIICAST